MAVANTSVLRYGKIYDRKMFYSIDSWGQSYKTFYGRNLRIFLISWSVCRVETVLRSRVGS